MSQKFSFTINSINTVSELPGAWTPKHSSELLKRLEFEGAADVTEDQLQEYAVMALQDLECPEAARALLDVVLGNKLSDGKKQNVSEEMESERLWEEYPDLSCHEPIFNAQVLLNKAFPSVPTPEVNLVRATLRPLDQAAEALLKEIASPNLPEAFITRCIAAASSETSILNRLFEDQVAGGPFPEAEHLVWHIQTEKAPAEDKFRAGYVLSLFSPIRWTESLEEDNVTECSPDTKS
ncbi:hypothetical protein VDG1235_917 [Verrucomicrobiia bacterium DG1235]|nr:hypothetical protein VDG1235_917 [Verrucomicrobiae bacterium DG1235]